MAENEEEEGLDRNDLTVFEKKEKKETFAWLAKWFWCSGDKLSVNLPDTLILEGQTVTQWLFTGKNGVILKKAEKTIRPNPLSKAIRLFSQSFHSNLASSEKLQGHSQTAAAVIHYLNGARKKNLFGDDLDQMNESMIKSEAGAALFQQGVFCTGLWIYCKYKLDANGVTFSSKVYASNKQSSSSGELSVQEQREIERTAAAIAKQVERNATGREKIAKMKLHFAQGLDGRLWLTNITNITFGCTNDRSISDQTKAMRGLLKAEGSISLTESSGKRHRKKTCPGDFCGYYPDHERIWQSMEAGLRTSAENGEEEEEMDKYGTCVSHMQVPEFELQKISYRSVALGQEKQTMDLMDPLLKSWTKRRRALSSKLKSIHVWIHAPARTTPGQTSSTKQPPIPVVYQERALNIEWEWTGRIDFVDVVLVPCQPNNTRQPDVEGPTMLAHACRNTGSLSIRIPLVNEAWKSDHGFWRIGVLDLGDNLVEAVSEAFLLGGTEPGEVPVVGRDCKVPTKSLGGEDDVLETSLDRPSFVQVHSLANYHKSAKVCKNCFRVYQHLDSKRLEQYERDTPFDGDALISGALEQQKKDPLLQHSQSDGVFKSRRHRDNVTKLQPILPVFNSIHGNSDGRERFDPESGECEDSAGLDRPVQGSKASKLFERLAIPKRASESETEFIDQQRWGAGFSLRSRRHGQKSKTSRTVSKSKKPAESKQAESDRPVRQTNKSNQGDASVSLPKINQAPSRKQGGSLTCAPGKRRTKLKHRSKADNPLLATYTDTEDEEEEGNGVQTSTGTKAKNKNKNKRPKDKTATKLSSPTRSPSMQQEKDVEPLNLESIKPGSNLHQILCLLGLGQLEDCKMLKRLVSKNGLAALAFCRVENGKVVLKKDAHFPDSKCSTLKKPPTFGEMLNRTKRGRQTLMLLSKFLSVCHMFVFALEKHARGASVETRVSLLMSRANDAVSTLGAFVAHHKIALPRYHILAGVQDMLMHKYDKAFEHWKEAVAVGARMEGMWSYNVGVAHFLIGKHATRINRGDTSFQQSHLSAATAIFSRLEEERELKIVQRVQDDESDAEAFEEEKHTHSSYTPRTLDAQDSMRDVQANGETPRLVAQARAEIHNTRTNLEARGWATLLQGQQKSSERFGPLHQAAEEVNRVLDAAQRDIEILESFSASRKKDKHHRHRKERIRDALELVNIKVEKFVQLAELDHLAGGGRATSSSSTMTTTSSGYVTSVASELSRDGSTGGSSSMGASLFTGEEEEEVADEFKVEQDGEDSEYDEYEDEEDEEDSQSIEDGSYRNEEEKDTDDPLSTDALFRACHEKKLMQMKQKLQAWTSGTGQSTSAAVDNQGNTLLHVAACCNWIQGIHTCLSLGIDVNAKNIEGNTALHLAREHQHNTVETLLIALGADTQATNIYGLTFEQGSRFH